MTLFVNPIYKVAIIAIFTNGKSLAIYLFFFLFFLWTYKSNISYIYRVKLYCGFDNVYVPLLPIFLAVCMLHKHFRQPFQNYCFFVVILLLPLLRCIIIEKSWYWNIVGLYKQSTANVLSLWWVRQWKVGPRGWLIPLFQIFFIKYSGTEPFLANLMQILKENFNLLFDSC